VAGISVHVEEITRLESAQHTVLLLHGLTEDGPTQEALGLELASAGFRVLLPDAPGHGRSGLPAAFTPEHRAAVVIGVLEQLCDGRVIVQGQSMGGESAAIVAATRSDLVLGVILEDPPILFALPPDGAPDVMQQNKRWITEMQQLDHAQRVTWGRQHMPTWSDFELEHWAVAKERCNVEVFDRAAGAPYPDWPSLLPQIEAPVLLFRGEPAQCIIDDATSYEIERLVPTISVFEIHGASHCIRRDRPSVVTSHVIAFCTAISAN
jgi:pimeloyl-ACP methyl ester carboxylesterase